MKLKPHIMSYIEASKSARRILLFLLYMGTQVTYAQVGISKNKEYSIDDFNKCEELAMNYYSRIQSLTLGDISAKEDLEQMWEEENSDLPNDIMVNKEKTTIGQYLVNILNNDVTIKIDLSDSLVFWNEPKALIAFRIKKTINNKEFTEYVTISLKSYRIHQIFDDLPNDFKQIVSFGGKQIRYPEKFMVIGKVTNKKGKPISGVSIIDDQYQGGGFFQDYSPNIDGSFEIPVKGEGTILTFSHFGKKKSEYKTQVIRVGSQRVLNVILEKK